MVFSGITFLVYFLPIFLLVYHLVPHKFKNAVILIGSFYFYSWGGPKFVFAILATTLLDFFLVNAMHNQKTQVAKKKFLIISLSINLGLLFYFKYCNFFIENFKAVSGADVSLLKVILPIGISFYTFESITYIVDVYRGLHAPLKNVWHYQTYILFFPKLIAGPIVRYNDIADQITNREKNYTPEIKLSGFLIFCLGLAKKSILANTLGMQADAVFNLPQNQIDTAAAWVGSIAYTMQIYFDFSGYSDMAIGIAKMLGFKLPENFNNPYTSISITDFWRRWHITLGTWMKNYLYIPLGGNKVSNVKLYRNLIVVFLLSGFWHGASWNFIIWGAFHGLFLVLDRLFLENILSKIPKIVSVLITLIIVNTAWILFKCEDLSLGTHVIKQLYSFNFFDGKFAMNNDFIFMVSVGFFFALFTLFSATKKIQGKVYSGNFTSATKWIAVLVGISLFYLSVSFITSLTFNPFIYFRF